MAIDAPARIAARPKLLIGPSEPEPPLEYRKMSFEEYLRLPEKPRAEWLDGVAVIRLVPAQFIHAYDAGRLFTVLTLAFPDLKVATDGPLHINNRMFVPDIMAIAASSYREKWIVDPPIIVVEVLSPSTRKYDLTTKSDAYLESGVKQYWTVDTDRGEIVVRENTGKAWHEVAKLDAQHPTIAVEVAGHGPVKLDRNWLFS